jgi:hypothetical protein
MGLIRRAARIITPGEGGKKRHAQDKQHLYKEDDSCKGKIQVFAYLRIYMLRGLHEFKRLEQERQNYSLMFDERRDPGIEHGPTIEQAGGAVCAPQLVKASRANDILAPDWTICSAQDVPCQPLLHVCRRPSLSTAQVVGWR